MRQTSLGLPLGVAAALLALAALLIGLALARPADLRADIGVAGDAYAVRNFFGHERGDDGATFRWSGRGAQVVAPAHGGPAVAELRLFGNPFAPPEAQTVTLARGGGPGAAFVVPPGWRVYRLLLPPAGPAGGAGAQSPLSLEAPGVRPGPGDPRDLGVALDRVALRFLAGPPPVGRALGLAWALGLAAATLALLARRAWLAPAVAAAGGAGLVAWAALSPGSLAWVPTPPAPLAGLSLALAALAALPRAAPLARRLPRWAWPAAAAALGHLALVPGLPPELRGAAALLLLGLPGALAALAIFDDEGDPLVRALLALAGAIAVGALLLLALQALPGPLDARLVVPAFDALALACGWAYLRRPPPAGPPAAHPYGLLALALLPGAALRLVSVGSAEFQGDEARALIFATGLRYGREGILLLHTKGPIETLLPAGPLAVTGQITELVARLPFTLASLGALLAAYLLARALLDGDRPGAGVAAGLAAALAAGLDGLLVGFGRIVQYQSVIVLLFAGALWLCWRFYQGAGRPQRHLLAAAALSAVGLLSHYDYVTLGPVLAGLVLAGGWRRGWRGAAWLRGLAPAVALGLGLVVAFYLPFVLNERFAATAGYLAGRTGEGDTPGRLFNNLPRYAALYSFYVSPQQAAAAAAGLALVLVAGLARHVRPRAAGLALAATLLAAIALTALAPGALASPVGSLAVLLFGLPLAGLWLLPGVPAHLRVMAAAFGAPFLGYAFLVAEPRTHYYPMHLPAALLLGYGAAWLWGALGRLRAARAAAALAGAGLLAVAGPYLIMVYVAQEPEYYRRFPEARPDLYRSLYGDVLPEEGYFGFPHRDGWKAARQLAETGAIGASYNVNQTIYLTGWYMRGAPICKFDPDSRFVVTGLGQQYIPDDRPLVGEVFDGQRRALDIYGRQAPPEGPRRYELAGLARAFDAAPVPDFPLSRALEELAPRVWLRHAWADGETLAGYDLHDGQLWLYWEGLTEEQAADLLRLELRDGASGAVAATLPASCLDSAPGPGGGVLFTSAPFDLRGAGLPPGSYELRAGLWRDGAWLPLAGGGETAPVTRVELP